MTSRRRKKVRAIAVAVVITLVSGACAGDDAGASQGTTKLASPTQTPAATGPTETAPAETAPAETGPVEIGPPPARASAAPDVGAAGAVEGVVGTCSDGARWQLELTDMGSRIAVRFEVHRSPVGHSWHVGLRHAHSGMGPFHWQHAKAFFVGTRMASESGDLVVQRSVVDQEQEFDGFRAKAVDQQTGQYCPRTGPAWRALAVIG